MESLGFNQRSGDVISFDFQACEFSNVEMKAFKRFQIKAKNINKIELRFQFASRAGEILIV